MIQVSLLAVTESLCSMAHLAETWLIETATTIVATDNLKCKDMLHWMWLFFFFVMNSIIIIIIIIIIIFFLRCVGMAC